MAQNCESHATGGSERNPVDVTVNGEVRRIVAGISVATLLETLGLSTEGVAVEVNRSIVPKRAHAETALKGGDEIEVVTFVGGG